MEQIDSLVIRLGVRIAMLEQAVTQRDAKIAELQAEVEKLRPTKAEKAKG